MCLLDIEVDEVLPPLNGGWRRRSVPPWLTCTLAGGWRACASRSDSSFAAWCSGWRAPTRRVAARREASVAGVGEVLRIWAAGHLNKSREVTSSGPYRWFAHPLYVGSSVMGVGLAIASGQRHRRGAHRRLSGVTITAAIRSEEAFLRQTFGDHYDRYRRGAVGERATRRARRRFSMAQAMANREYRALTGAGARGVAAVLKATYNGTFWRAAGARSERAGRLAQW